MAPKKKPAANKAVEAPADDEPKEAVAATVSDDGETIVEQLPGGGTRERPSRRYQPGHE